MAVALFLAMAVGAGITYAANSNRHCDTLLNEGYYCANPGAMCAGVGSPAACTLVMYECPGGVTHEGVAGIVPGCSGCLCQ
jgi:hypothetical protein